ncbi:MAG: oligosaccharide flippase family protein [Thermoplasmata archaeon]
MLFLSLPYAHHRVLLPRTGSALTDTSRETTRRNVPWVYLGMLSFSLSGAVFYLYLAHLLPPAELGIVVVLLAITALVSTSFSLGLGPGFQHYLSYHIGRGEPETLRRLTRSSLLAASLLGIAAASTTAAGASLLSGWFFHSSDYTGLIALVAVYVGLSTAFTLLQSVLIGLQRFVAYSAITVAGYAAVYGSPVAVFAVWPGVRSIILGWSIGAGLGCALTFLAILRQPDLPNARDGVRPSVGGRDLYRSLLLYSLPMFVYSIVSTGAIYIDRLVLASLASLSSVGVYNYAILVGSGSLFAVAPFSTILLPKISERFGQGRPAAIRGMVRTSSTLIVLVYVPIALGLASIGPVLLRVLVGSDYVSAAGPMAVLLCLTAVAVPYSVLTSLAAGIRRTRLLVLASAFAVGTNAGLSFLLVPRWGMTGAAVGNSTMTWGVLVVLVAALYDTGLLAFDGRSVGRIWACSIAMAAVAGLPLYLLGEPMLLAPPLVLVAVGVLLVLLRVTHAVPLEVREFVESILPRWMAFARPLIRWVAPAEPRATIGDRDPTLVGGLASIPAGRRADTPNLPFGPAADPPDRLPPPARSLLRSGANVGSESPDPRDR